MQNHTGFRYVVRKSIFYFAVYPQVLYQVQSELNSKNFTVPIRTFLHLDSQNPHIFTVSSNSHKCEPVHSSHAQALASGIWHDSEGNRSVDFHEWQICIENHGTCGITHHAQLLRALDLIESVGSLHASARCFGASVIRAWTEFGKTWFASFGKFHCSTH